MKPKKLPALTPNAHSRGLSFMPYVCSSLKASFRGLAWSKRSLDFTSMSST